MLGIGTTVIKKSAPYNSEHYIIIFINDAQFSFFLPDNLTFKLTFVTQGKLTSEILLGQKQLLFNL